jgi:glutathione S-transferase
VVAEAERWGERVLQPVPRRLFRYLMLTHADARVWLGQEILRLPAAEVLQWAFMPAVRALAAISHSDEATVRDTIARLPELLDHADALVADGVIAGDRPNAADYQVLSGVRVLLEFEELRTITGGRPSAAAARRLFPDWEGPAPRGLPPA